MAQVIPMMEGHNFNGMGDPNTEYDIHAHPDQDISSPNAGGGTPQAGHIGHPSMDAAGEQYGDQFYGHAPAAAQYGGHPSYGAGFENGVNDGGERDQGAEEELQAGGGGGAGDNKPPRHRDSQYYIDPERLEQPLKLFVGQVPKSMMEEDLAFIFEPYGRILDLTVIRDRRSGNHRGCAFVTYESGNDSMKVVAEMHGKYKFEGAPWPAQVRPAAGEIDESSGKVDLDGKSFSLSVCILCSFLFCKQH